MVCLHVSNFVSSLTQSLNFCEGRYEEDEIPSSSNSRPTKPTLAGRRIVQVRAQRTKVDYAQFMKMVVDEHYPEVDCIRLVQDNLNTHSAGSFYEAFAADTAHALKNKFEYHYTPKKASWLNMVEIELSIIAKQCLDRRIPSMAALAREVKSFTHKRNRARATVKWRFTTAKARAKLKSRYAEAYNN